MGEEQIPDLALAIEGCEKHSSDADFEALGALIYRNRAVILGALAAARERDQLLEQIALRTLSSLERSMQEIMRINNEMLATVKTREAEITRLRDAFSRENEDISQVLGKALGYPWFKDDPANFPDATAADGVCVGEHVAISLADEAAAKIARLREALEAAEAPVAVPSIADLPTTEERMAALDALKERMCFHCGWLDPECQCSNDE